MKSHIRFLPALALCLYASTASVRAESADEAAALKAANAYVAALQNGDYASIYSTFPAASRQEIEKTVKLFGSKMDPGLWSSIQSVLVKFAATATKQNRFIAKDDFARAAIVRGATKFGAMAKAASIDALKAGDVAALLAVKPFTMKGVTDRLPAVAAPVLTAVSSGDGKVVISGAGGQFDMVKFNGVWLPGDLAAFFSDDSAIKDVQKSISELSFDPMQVMQFQGAISGFESLATQLGKAATEEQFQQTMATGMLPLMMLLNQFDAQ